MNKPYDVEIQYTKNAAMLHRPPMLVTVRDIETVWAKDAAHARSIVQSGRFGPVMLVGVTIQDGWKE